MRLAHTLLAYALLALAALAPLAPRIAEAQQPDARFYSQLRWRLVGPFRGGRTVAAVGVPGHPGLFYIGVNNGGVWRTTDYGRVWTPIFDSVSTGSVGAIAVAPSNPDILYVGSGEGLQRPDLSIGDGIYKSTDAGRTWRHLGLRDGQRIAQVVVDPRDPSRVFAAALGHSYPIAAILRDTPREPVGPWVLPGTYTVRLIAAGEALTQPLAVRMDPRVTTPPAAWVRMFALSSRVVEAMRADSALLAEVQGRRRASGAAAPGAAGGPVADSLAAVERDLRRLNSQLTGLLGLIEDADAAPTTQAVRAVGELERAVETARARVRAVGGGSR